MALAETQIIQQTKQELEDEGVNLDELKYQFYLFDEFGSNELIDIEI